MLSKKKYKRDPVKNAKNRQVFFDKMYPGVPKEGVYLIYDELKQLVYVGESNNVPRRLAEHIGGYDIKKSFHKGKLDTCFVKEYYTFEIIKTLDFKDRLIKEIEIEFKYKPLYNKRWEKK